MKEKKGGYRGKVSTGWGKPSRPTPRHSVPRRVGAVACWQVYGGPRGLPGRGWQPFVAWSAGEESGVEKSESTESGLG